MRAADALCLSSVLEGFPNVILEALACRLPVIATDVGGISEKIGPPGTGELVPREELDAYVAAMERQMERSDRRPREETGADSWGAVAEQYREILDSAIK